MKCANYSGNEFPPLTVTNGLAKFDAMGVYFAGYVTPQGHLRMTSGYGATVSGNVKEIPVDEDFDGGLRRHTNLVAFICPTLCGGLVAALAETRETHS